MNNNIEEIIKNKLDKRVLEPTLGSWDTIEKQLDKQNYKKYFWYAAAGVCVLLFSITIFKNFDNKVENESFSIENKKQDIIPNNSKIQQTHNIKLENNTKLQAKNRFQKLELNDTLDYETKEKKDINTIKDFKKVLPKVELVFVKQDALDFPDSIISVHSKPIKNKSYVNKELLLFAVENEKELKEYKKTTKDKVLTYIDEKIINKPKK